jgi:SSS family solute:Na+ symporter
VFLLGIFWKGMTGAGAITTLVLGHALGASVLGWKIWTQGQGVSDGLPHFTIVAGITTGICLVIGVLASAITARPAPERVEGGLWTIGDGAGAGGLKDYRWQASALVLIVAALIWIFR